MKHMNKEFNNSNLDMMQIVDNFDYNFFSSEPNDTKLLAKHISKGLKENDIIVLNGELGSGKTAFMLGLAEFFNIENQISSPTFTIVNEYITKQNQNIYHFDVYRLKDEIEFGDQIGTEYFSNGISIIEWGNIIENILPKNTIFIDITKDYDNENHRYFHIWRKSL